MNRDTPDSAPSVTTKLDPAFATRPVGAPPGMATVSATFVPFAW